MQILVDNSIWIDYFRNGNNSELLDLFIDQNIICINDVILAELVPFLKLKNQNNVVRLLKNITNNMIRSVGQEISDRKAAEGKLRRTMGDLARSNAELTAKQSHGLPRRFAPRKDHFLWSFSIIKPK